MFWKIFAQKVHFIDSVHTCKALSHKHNNSKEKKEFCMKLAIQLNTDFLNETAQQRLRGENLFIFFNSIKCYTTIISIYIKMLWLT